jgi:paraquat-inducible protein B
MSSKPHYFAIGLFVMIGTALGLVGIIAVSSDAMRSSKYFIETYVDESVQGIDIGTPFKFRGVKVGNVSEIAMVSTVYDTSRMYVMIRVALEDRAVMEDQEAWQQQIGEMISEGLRLKLVPQGITGLSFLEAEFYPDTESAPLEIDWEPDYIYIPSTPAMMTLLSRSIERMAAEISTLNLEEIGHNVESITSNLNQSVIHMEQITRTAAEASGGIITNVTLAADSLPVAGTNLVETIALVQGMIMDSDQELDQIILNLRYITEDTRELMRMIKRHPGMLLAEPPDKNLSREGRK